VKRFAERHGWLIALCAGACVIILDLQWLNTLHYRVPLADFYVYYSAAQTGQAHGWAAMYDPSTFLPAVTRAVGRPLPYLNPPELAWLVLPLSWLPYGLASLIWGVILSVSLGLTWLMAAPGASKVRIVHLLAAVTLLPVFVSVLIGQASLIIVAIVALGWWLIGREHPWLAGATLSLIFLKPQLAFLVPLALLLAGYWRVFLAWLAVTAALAGIALIAVGTSVFHQVIESLAQVHGIPGPVQMSLERQLPWPIATIGLLLVAAISVVVTMRWRGEGPSIPIAVGLLASMLVSPYVNFYDLSAPLLASWLILRANPPRWHQATIAAMYIPAFVAPIVPLVTVAALLLLLASLLVLRPRDQEARQVAGAWAA
jgi:glycosyl transferase family 87